MNKIKNILKRTITGLPFGLKGANDVIMGKEDTLPNNTTINEEISENRVGKHLLKGEVTQDVADLRYRTYKIDNNAKNYTYLGNGIAVKNTDEKNENKGKTKYHFSQSNHIICESILTTLQQVGKHGIDKYWTEIQYREYPKFKLEKYIMLIDVDINDKECFTTLHISTSPNPYDVSSRPFINYLENILKDPSEYTLSHDSVLGNIESLSFSTYKAINEDDYVTYSFVNGGQCISIKKVKDEFILKFKWKYYMRVPLNLEEKFYSVNMEKKYEDNTPKIQPLPIDGTPRKQYCSVCGQEMSVYDADIQKANGGKPICVNCLKKALINEK